MTTATKAFEVGKTYEMSWVTSSSKNACKVLKRTKCFVTLDVERHGISRCKIHNYSMDDAEFALPLGNYSMAPCVGADDEIEA
ncbi:predicted protein [Cyanophage PSS2]|uniref:hypothetical protein n=1 Tax=Cyanophage PSS2 TaxID=658401 RepID=UPI0001B03FE8|nr:hypothetical protein PSS2_gp019 [Cyanophage PSS2]ACT65581.1 hypothetical protein [Cyanophage PSS2]ACY75723.1 predicted protein [Cyanophage PSS2]